MQQHEPEVEDAKKRLAAQGRNPDDFSFDVKYLPPDPDGGGMFTVTYEVTIADSKSGKEMTTLGGIGYDWVGHFEDELKSGHFA
ncbi:MAG: hypothetical protein HKN60_06325 [Rhizobiales bacterium]|nr:hypothetical protein [Hyphomicrobiales bacterium]